MHGEGQGNVIRDIPSLGANWAPARLGMHGYECVVPRSVVDVHKLIGLKRELPE